MSNVPEANVHMTIVGNELTKLSYMKTGGLLSRLTFSKQDNEQLVSYIKQIARKNITIWNNRFAKDALLGELDIKWENDK